MGEASQPWCLSANPDGCREPLVFLHTWGIQEPPYFASLAGAVGPEQPIYAIQPPAAAECASFNDVADWVAYEYEFLAQLPVRPPYRLAGWSFGGLVALELARRLTAEGQSVASVDLIDSWLPRRIPRTAGGRLIYHLEKARRLPKPDRQVYLRSLARRLPGAAARLTAKHARHAANRLRRHSPPDRSELDPRLRAVWVPCFKYEPQDYPDQVTIFACDESITRNRGDKSLGWSRWLTGGFQVVRLPGTHESLWEQPHVSVLADTLGRRATAEGPRATGRVRMVR